MQDFALYFSWGWHHIMSWDALDHLLFIVALTVIYQLHDWKQVLILVTAFTIGHFITLLLSVLDILRFSARWVEFLIPLTIVITAAINFFQRSFSPRAVSINYLLALGFGLIHGMGFANAIRFSLVKEQSLGWSLFGFNLGLECGQIVVVLAVLSLEELIRRLTGINRGKWVMIISAIVLVIALNMVVDRIPK
jgi:hypothetical protein